MTTFLELSQRLRQEAGISGTGPSSVTGQTGEMKRVVDWISAAYEDVQIKHPCWQFLRTEFSFSTIASTSAYLPSAVSLTEHADWIEQNLTCYLTSVADEQPLDVIPWDEFKGAYQIGTISTGRPSIAAIKPDKSLIFWPTSDAAYTIRGEYYKRAQSMTANADEPLFPARFHLILVWRALMLYGAQESAPEVYAHGLNEYRRMMNALSRDQLPAKTLGGPLV